MNKLNREMKLRFLILDRYPSLRDFSRQTEIPYSTLMTVFKRGISGAGFDLVIKICRALDINPDEL